MDYQCKDCKHGITIGKNGWIIVCTNVCSKQCSHIAIDEKLKSIRCEYFESKCIDDEKVSDEKMNELHQDVPQPIIPNQYTYVCRQCEQHGGGICKLVVEQDNGPPAETPSLCNWAYSIDDSKAIWIPQFQHTPEFYICVKNYPEILISSAYATKEAAQSFIDEWYLHNCEVIEL